MSPADAAGNATGIALPAAPPTTTPARVAPDAGDYPANFSGSASVNGRAQSFPSSGSMVFTPTGSNLRQSSPNTPGDVKITQHFSATRSSLVNFQMKASDSIKTFTPSSAATFIPFDAPGGTTWSWSATSDDGATHVSANSSIGGTQTMTVGGQPVSVFEVVTTLSMSGDINGTATITLWVSPQYRLPVQMRQVINAKGSSGYGFSTQLKSDVTQTLTQLTPSSH